MSRIDDDHAARRTTERIALQKQQEEQKTKKTRDEANAFSRLLQQNQQKPPQPFQETKRPTTLAQQVLSEAARSEAPADGDTKLKKPFQELLGSKELPQEAPRMGGEPQLQEAMGQEVRQHEEVSEGRTEDAKGGDERLDERSDEHGKTSDVLTGRGGALRTSRDSGGGAGAGGGGSQGEGSRDSGADKGGAAASFRFNPALMAPVSVARPKEIPNSDRLRKIAAEIAQKIVERVRVGTNALGNTEFQIDLRSDVLSGLSIKISTQNGKIKASFSGSNREVLKLLKENADSLKEALTKRGLTLADLKIEERA